MNKKTKPKKFVSYEKLKKTSPSSTTLASDYNPTKSYAVSRSSLKRALPKGPLILLSLAELETGQLDLPDAQGKTQIMVCWKYLQKAFPKAFSMDNPLPLRTGIHHHICRNNAKISIVAVCSVLSSYTGTARYREALCTHTVRIGLDGEHSGTVSAKQVASAQQQLNSNATSTDDKVA